MPSNKKRDIILEFIENYQEVIIEENDMIDNLIDSYMIESDKFSHDHIVFINHLKRKMEFNLNELRKIEKEIENHKTKQISSLKN